MKTFEIVFLDDNNKELYRIVLPAETFEQAYEFADTHMNNTPDDSSQIVVTEITQP